MVEHDMNVAIIQKAERYFINKAFDFNKLSLLSIRKTPVRLDGAVKSLIYCVGAVFEKLDILCMVCSETFEKKVIFEVCAYLQRSQSIHA
ncbi:MAG: hypothetical protein GY797_34955 [Deltaproteobacteria bacterium]|nr:hypothetical protein [Deltaproteobacteria bacterium]